MTSTQVLMRMPSTHPAAILWELPHWRAVDLADCKDQFFWWNFFLSRIKMEAGVGGEKDTAVLEITSLQGRWPW